MWDVGCYVDVKSWVLSRLEGGKLFAKFIMLVSELLVVCLVLEVARLSDSQSVDSLVRGDRVYLSFLMCQGFCGGRSKGFRAG